MNILETFVNIMLDRLLMTNNCGIFKQYLSSMKFNINSSFKNQICAFLF